MSAKVSSAREGAAANNPAPSRAVPMWVGATPDSVPPPRVRLRVFQAYDGRCWRSGTKIMPGMAWDLDHKQALANGGKNDEANLAPILRGKVHQAKTAEDVALKAKTDRIAKRHIGIKTGRGFPKHPTLKRRMDGSVVRR